MIVGFGMMPRGEVGMIAATIALTSGAFSGTLYATIVAMSLITTLVAPSLVAYAFKRKEGMFGRPPRSMRSEKRRI